MSPVTSLHSSRVEMLAGDPEAAERDLRIDFEKLSGMGEKYLLPLVAALLARAVSGQARYDEAVKLTQTAEELADDDDVEPQAIWRCVRAHLLVRTGEQVEAERLAREAVGMLAGIEAPDLHGDCLVALAEVLAAQGRTEDARAALRQAFDLYGLKGNLVSADRVLAIEGEFRVSAA